MNWALTFALTGALFVTPCRAADDGPDPDLDSFTIYRYEWLRGGTELGPYGQYHVDEIAKLLSKAPFNVVVQPSRNRTLDRARHAYIVRLLREHGVDTASSRVVVRSIELIYDH